MKKTLNQYEKQDRKQKRARNLCLVATAALAFGFLLAPAVGRAQSANSSYEGVSQPPADDTIQASPEPAAPPVRSKPSPGVPAAQPANAVSRPASSTYVANAPVADSPSDLNDPKSADYGIVSSVPSDHSEGPASARDARLVSRPENPDYDIVGFVPSPSNQLAEGTDIRVRLLQNLSTSTTQDGQSFRGQIAAAVYKEGRVVIPEGSELRGRVVSVTQGHRMGTPATLRLRPEAVTLPDGSSYHLYAQAIHTDAPHTRTDSEGGLQPSSRVARNLVEYGAGAGGGAATGAVLGGPVGAAAGAIVGAGIVTTHLLLQHPHQTSIEQGAEVTFSLTEPMDLVPARN